MKITSRADLVLVKFRLSVKEVLGKHFSDFYADAPKWYDTEIEAIKVIPPPDTLRITSEIVQINMMIFKYARETSTHAATLHQGRF